MEIERRESERKLCSGRGRGRMECEFIETVCFPAERETHLQLATELPMSRGREPAPEKSHTPDPGTWSKGQHSMSTGSCEIEGGAPTICK